MIGRRAGSTAILGLLVIAGANVAGCGGAPAPGGEPEARAENVKTAVLHVEGMT